MTVKTYSGIALEFRAIGNGVLNPRADAWHKAADAIESAAARVAELEAELKALREQKPVGEVRALMFDDSSCDLAEMYCNGIYPIGTKLYAAPVAASAEVLDTDAVADICNAYESGVGHRGRPTAHINPYKQGTPESIAYALGAIKEQHGMEAIGAGAG